MPLGIRSDVARTLYEHFDFLIKTINITDVLISDATHSFYNISTKAGGSLIKSPSLWKMLSQKKSESEKNYFGSKEAFE